MTDEQQPAGQPPHPWPSQSPPTAPRSRVPTAAIVALLGGLLTTLSAFLVWATVTDSRSGTWEHTGMQDGGDGVIALLIGVAVLACGTAALSPAAGEFVRRAPIFLGGLAAAVAVVDVAAVEQEARNAALWASNGAWTYVQTGPGLYVLLVGGIVTTLSGFSSRPR